MIQKIRHNVLKLLSPDGQKKVAQGLKRYYPNDP